MPAMIRRRFFAIVAAFAVAFGALWPLVSAAMPRAAQVPVFICSQAGGGQHVPGVPTDSGDDFHCPLCIATTDFIVPSIADASKLPLAIASVLVAPGHSTPEHIFFARPPPSRAPPALS
jgi:hypothetical protein